MVALIDNGVEIDFINVGGIAKKPETTTIIPAVGIDKEMAGELKRVNEEKDVEVYFQQVPSTEKVSLESALKKIN
jgi:mannose/fructose/N-acetylgalactosamine-specific phosphotransferase system component IIB